VKWPWQHRKEPLRASLPDNGGVVGRLNEYSETWVFVRDHCEKQLAELRENNDNPSLDEQKTAVLRGRIYELKEILELPKPRPTMQQSMDDYQ
jgi:hypothetical protein